MSQTLAAVQGITNKSDGDARLQQLRGELDQSLEVAKRVEQRVDSLLNERSLKKHLTEVRSLEYPTFLLFGENLQHKGLHLSLDFEKLLQLWAYEMQKSPR